MTLGFSIDNVTFRQLVDAALRKIPTASRGNWTLHAPVDPGISIVELFAWLLEQRAFWADQVTAPLVRRVMALFGDDLRAARPAGVAITFEPELAVPAVAHAQISRHTVLRVPDTELMFTLRHGLTALALARYSSASASASATGAPVVLLDGVAGYGSEDLRSGRPVPLLPVGRAAEARIGIALAAPPPARAALPLSILFELDTAVLPEWHPDAAAALPPAVLRWEYQTTAGAWLPLAQLSDGTLGLRRSGVLRFALPDQWSAYGEGPGQDRIGWLRVATDDASFSSPPTVLRIAPNTALASHQVWKTHASSPGWLPLPARTLQLDAAPLPLADRMFVRIDEPGGRHRWRVIPDLVRAGPGDRVAVVDRERARVVFGDGLTGRVPRLDETAAPQVMVRYAAGGGTTGNVPPCAWEIVAGALPCDVPGTIGTARSLVAAVGGRDPETLDDARTRAAAALHTPRRAVTPEDHEAIACNTPGVAVARAHAEVGLWCGKRAEHGAVPGVTTVFIVPGIAARTRDAVRDGRAVAAPAPDPGALHQVRRRLARARLIGEAIHVEPPRYRRIRVRITVAAASIDSEAMRQRLGGALRLYLDPLLGGDDQAGWPFGQPVRPTALLGIAQRELGDRADVTAIAVSLDGGAPVTCGDVAIRGHELVAVDAIDVVIQAARAAEAGLR